MHFELLGPIQGITSIAKGRGIRGLARLVKRYGRGRWRKRKGRARIRLPDGAVVEAELHWYEANGIGMKELKLKRLLDQ